MIDLRSDTLTKPSPKMRLAMLFAKIGDDGRINKLGRGEDPTVNRLEYMAAKLTGHEDAMFCNSGTMGNIVSILTHCTRNSYVCLDSNSHIYQYEKSLFSKKYFGLIPSFFNTYADGQPIINSIENCIKQKHINLLCLENTHNLNGGTCLSIHQIQKIIEIANKNNILTHLDGARIVNASAYYNIPVHKLTSEFDSVMFCLSKGLSAPIGSMVCGNKKFINKAKKIRKTLGGGMRQSGIIASAGIKALSNINKINTDNKKALYFYDNIISNGKIIIMPVQTNIINIDVSPSGLSSIQFTELLEQKGVKVKIISKYKIRLTMYNDIKKHHIKKVLFIINKICKEL